MKEKVDARNDTMAVCMLDLAGGMQCAGGTYPYVNAHASVTNCLGADTRTDTG
jgi:hypothetical protein